MPYKDINKRRECNKLAMRRSRAAKKANNNIISQTYDKLQKQNTRVIGVRIRDMLQELKKQGYFGDENE